ncbi:MAG: hypothetical protein V4613_13860 [Bacteroidota bacterium]
MKKYIILKLIGLAVLTIATLVIISILEVTVYSYLVNPGQTMSVYDAHAEYSAPYISGVFGFIVFFMVARHWKKRQYPNAFRLSMLFPLVYVLMDMVIIIAATMEHWLDFVGIFLIANSAKFLG